MRTKNVAKEIVGKKIANNVSIYTHEYRAQKMGGKTRETIFQKHTNSAKKKLEKNRRKKGRKTFFYIHTNIVTKKWGDKTSETIFPETHE